MRPVNAVNAANAAAGDAAPARAASAGAAEAPGVGADGAAPGQTFWQVEGRRAVLWLPVFLGIGIWIYFALPEEPPGWTALLWLAPIGWLAATLLPRRPKGVGALAAGLAALALTAGFALGKAGTERAAAPVLPWPMAETVEGRVIGVGRSASGAPRVLLDRVVIYGLERHQVPARVRVTLLAAERDAVPGPGSRLRVYARLSPPGGPVEPGAFDFRLRAWFDRLGAVGYARGPALLVPAWPPGGPLDRALLWLHDRRLALADGLRAALPGAEGAFAAALVTGDRSAIEEADAEALRLSNLAHLLAISGLHMGILTGLVFAVARLVLASLPGLARRVSAKKLAALAALVAGAAYLALSGGTVATQRAFVMAGVALVAVLLDRPAISLRALAVAAVIVLTIRPVSLLEVGFQMSFAATTALVAGWEAVRTLRQRRRRPVAHGLAGQLGRKAALYVGALVFTSLLAGLATAPYAAWQFNRAATWGLLANLAAVPAMGMLIAPAAVAAGLLAPLGLEGPALAVMGAGIAWVLDVAHWVAGLPGAVRAVPAGGAHVPALVTIGGLWLCLWRGWWRLAGLAPVVLALVLWTAGERRPDLLVGEDGRLLGLLTPAGRAVDHPRSQGFAARSWLRRDGDLAEQAAAAARPGFRITRGRSAATLPNGWEVLLVKSRKPEGLEALCEPRVLLIARHGRPLRGPCRYFGKRALRRLGALAVWVEGDGLRVLGAEGTVDRPWAPRR